MWPILFHLGAVAVYSYGVLYALGILAAVLWIRHSCKRARLDVGRSTWLLFVFIAFGIAGAHLLHAVVALLKDGRGEQGLFPLFLSGRVWYGVPLVGIPSLFLFAPLFKIRPLPFLDIIAPGLALFQSISRIGCLLSGCCYGRPTGLNFGVRYVSVLLPEEYQNVYLHPTQLYEALANLLLFFVLAHALLRRRFDGQILILYLIGYSLARFIIESFRGDAAERGYVVEGLISSSQFIATGVILVAAAASEILSARGKSRQQLTSR